MKHIKTEGDIHTYEFSTKELQTIMNNIKKPRFSLQEKSMVNMVLRNFLEDHPYAQDVAEVRNLLKKFGGN